MSDFYLEAESYWLFTVSDFYLEAESYWLFTVSDFYLEAESYWLFTVSDFYLEAEFYWLFTVSDFYLEAESYWLFTVSDFSTSQFTIAVTITKSSKQMDVTLMKLVYAMAKLQLSHCLSLITFNMILGQQVFHVLGTKLKLSLIYESRTGFDSTLTVCTLKARIFPVLTIPLIA